MSDLFDDKLLAKTADMLWKAITNGIGFDFADIDYESPDYEYLSNLEKNVYQFSAAKNYNQLRSMTDALLDNNGQARSFNDFRKEVEKINKMYNENWLRTEYNTANMAATNAGRWKDYENNADIMPYLQYEAVMDERTRESHRELDGIVKKIDDPFWSTYAPPNDYNCRCTIIQLPGADEKETNTKNRKLPSVPKMFAENLAKKGIAFPKGHPYFDRTPKTILKRAEDTRVKVKPRTVKDYENAAINGGLAKHVNYKGIPKSAMKDINKALQECKDKTGFAFDEIKTTEVNKNSYIMGTSTNKLTNKKTLLINRNWFNTKEIEKSLSFFKSQKKENWFTAENTKEIIYHEFGHLLTTTNMYKQGVNRKLPGLTDITKYASINKYECNAEIFSLYMQGEKLKPAWIDTFNQYSEFKIKK